MFSCSGRAPSHPRTPREVPRPARSSQGLHHTIADRGCCALSSIHPRSDRRVPTHASGLCLFLWGLGEWEGTALGSMKGKSNQMPAAVRPRITVRDRSWAVLVGRVIHAFLGAGAAGPIGAREAAFSASRLYGGACRVTPSLDTWFPSIPGHRTPPNKALRPGMTPTAETHHPPSPEKLYPPPRVNRV